MGIYSGPWSGLNQMETLWSVAAASVPFWLVLGGVIGLLIPRPRWLEVSSKSYTGAVLYVTPPGLFVRRAALFFHGAYIFREIWNYCTLPNSQGFWTTLGNVVLGKSYTGQQQPAKTAAPKHAPATVKHKHSRHQPDNDDDIDWYVDRSDLQLFKDKIETEDGSNPNPWEPMMDKDYGNFTYTAWRRKLPDGKTDYKSVTVANNATAEEFMDFYFDDITRMHWDSMISETEVLENGPSKHRCQVVRWLRTFPFAFISKREYVIARRMFKEHGCLYGITKGIDHPRAMSNPEIVRMEVFYSMWRSRTIPDPKGSDQPACETVLLHHEEFKVPENMARFAVKHGMAGFVKKLGPNVKHFVEERRKRVHPFEHDPNGFGVNTVPNPPLESERCSELDDCLSEMSVEDSEPSRSTRQLRVKTKAKNNWARKAAVVGGIGLGVMLLGRRKNPKRANQG